MKAGIVRCAHRPLVIALMVCTGLALGGCVGDRLYLNYKLLPRNGTETGGAEEELERLLQRAPLKAAPLVSFVAGEQYVTTSTVELVWVNPTENAWYLAPGAEHFVVKRQPLTTGPRSGLLLGTRVDSGREAQFRSIGPDAELKNERGLLHIPKTVKSGSSYLIWPGILDPLAAGASRVSLDERLVLSPHSKGHVTCLFVAYGYSRAEFTLQLANGVRRTDFSVPLVLRK